MNRPGSTRRFFRIPWRSRRQVAADVDDELRFHLEEMAADLRARGWSEADARDEAARRFGDLTFTRDYCRAEDLRRERGQRRMTILDELGQDLRYSVRALRKSPGFTATALLTLALGIGANTAIFSVVRGVLLEPLPFRDSERIVRLWHAHRGDAVDRGAVSEPDLLDWREQSSLIEAVGGFFYRDGGTGMDMTGTGEPERISTALVTDGFFETLGTPAMIGRYLRPEENVAGNDRVVVISHGFWTRRFGADPGILGQSITLNNEPFQIVGVMPPDLTYPAEGTLDAWIPLSVFGPESIGRARASRFMSVIAKVKPGVTEDQLTAELSGISARLASEHPEQNAGWDNVTVASIRESIIGEVRQPLMVLMAAVAMLLLVACVNIASLLLARATGRQQELAVRAALGAGRARITRQLVTESVTLAILGGILGIALAFVAVRALRLAGASELPRAGEIGIDGIVLAFTLAVSVVSGLIFGIIPALRASANLEQSLRAGARGTVGGTGQKLRKGLVIAEVALAVILVVGAGLATKSFVRLTSVDPGFRPENALVVNLSTPEFDSPQARLDYYYRVLEAIRAVPGVEAAGSARDIPLRGVGEMIRPEVPGRPSPAGEGPSAQRHHVSTDYFKALGVPLRQGRTFEMTDRGDAPNVIVINEAMARRFWPGENPIGQVLNVGYETTVIGIVGDVRQAGLAEPVEPALYHHALQQFRSRMTIVVRTAGDPLRYANSVRQAIWTLNPTQTITNTTTLQSVLGTAVARPRLLAWLLALFGIIGLVLGALGIFGVLAYAVTQRQREIGVRVALGAPPRSVLGLVVGQGLVLASIGVLLGMLVAFMLTASMQSILYGIEASDPITFLQVAVVLMAAALLASWLPARRALGIDPATALRYE